MNNFDIYNDISCRTGGDIYIGVVGPVRTGKSTFITKFMEQLVLPNISNSLQKKIATDEMPQSADGKAIYTTQPKFIPANAVNVKFNNKCSANVRLIDCVGYMIDGIDKENSASRNVKTPWDQNEIPFEKASEIGTTKVINEYSTIGIVVTTDGSFGGIARENYIAAENKVIENVKKTNKPFIVIVNCQNEKSEKTINICQEIEIKHNVSVIPVNVQKLDSDGLYNIMDKILLEFPLNEINVNLPKWIQALPSDNYLIKEICENIKKSSTNLCKMKDYNLLEETFTNNDNVESFELSEIKTDRGIAEYTLKTNENLLYKIIANECNENIEDDYDLLTYIKSFAEYKNKYEKIKDAIDSAEENGYGIVLPKLEEMDLKEPVLVKSGGKYGVKLKASAPSLHIMKVNVETEVSPIVGTEKQSEEMVKYLMSNFEESPEKIWETDIFGKSLHELVKEGLSNKINSMPADSKNKMQKTLCRMVNENKGGIICILI